MVTYTLINNTEPIALLENLANQVPMLFPSILFLIFVVIAGAGYVSSEKRTGRANFLMWVAISGYMTAIMAMILFLYNALIPLDVVVLFVVIAPSTDTMLAVDTSCK